MSNNTDSINKLHKLNRSVLIKKAHEAYGPYS